MADRALSRPGVGKLRERRPITLDGARQRFGRRMSEEELLLRLTMPAEQVDAMLAGPGRPLELGARNGSHRAPLVELALASGRARIRFIGFGGTGLRELEQRPGISYLEMVRGDETVVCRRGG